MLNSFGTHSFKQVPRTATYVLNLALYSRCFEVTKNVYGVLYFIRKAVPFMLEYSPKITFAQPKNGPIDIHS